jgi:hypothetical protein
MGRVRFSEVVFMASPLYGVAVYYPVNNALFLWLEKLA